MAVPQIESTPDWLSYIDLSNDVKPYLMIPSTDVTRDAVLQDIIDAACWWAQDYLSRPIAPTTFFRRFNGYSGFGGSMIMLPYAPVLAVPTVTETWGNSGQHVLTLQTPESQGGSDMFTLDAINGIITRSYLGLLARPFFPGLKNVEVTWTAGYNPIPRHWILATKELVKYWWENTQTASRTFQPHNEYDNVNDRYALWPAVPDRISLMFQSALSVGLA